MDDAVFHGYILKQHTHNINRMPTGRTVSPEIIRCSIISAYHHQLMTSHLSSSGADTRFHLSPSATVVGIPRRRLIGLWAATGAATGAAIGAATGAATGAAIGAAVTPRPFVRQTRRIMPQYIANWKRRGQLDARGRTELNDEL